MKSAVKTSKAVKKKEWENAWGSGYDEGYKQGQIDLQSKSVNPLIINLKERYELKNSSMHKA